MLTSSREVKSIGTKDIVVTEIWNWYEYRNLKNDPVNDIGADALETINDCDVTKFKVIREKAVSQLANRYLRSTARVY